MGALVLGAVGGSAPIWAQSTNDIPLRGIQLRFGLGLRAEAQSNRTLDPVNSDSSTELAADLSFGLLSETPQDRLALNLAGSLRALDGEGAANLDNGFSEPRVDLNYTRSAIDSRLSLNAEARKTDLGDRDSLFFDETTGLFTIVNGTATLRRESFSAAYDWGLGGPFELGVVARFSRSEYSDGSATGIGGSTLNDNERRTLSASARLALTEALSLDTTLSYSAFEEDGTPGTRDTVALYNSLVLGRPGGNVSFSFGVTDTEEGQRYSANVGRSLEMPFGTLSGQLGATRGVDGDTSLTGGLSASYALPSGTVTANLSRSVSSGSEQDNEQVNTSLRLGYSQALTPVSNIGFAIDFADATVSSTGLGTTSGNFSATYTRDLTPDWDMDLGYRYRHRSQSTGPSAKSNEVFLNLRRDFLTRF